MEINWAAPYPPRRARPHLLDCPRGRGEMADAADLKSAAAKAASRFDPGRPYFFPRTQSSGAGFPAKRSPIQSTASPAVWNATRMWLSSWTTW
jgi:hypothetical protein